jgi:hypothetical protein
MPATSDTIWALITSAASKAKSLFALKKLYTWDRTPERTLIRVASSTYAEMSGTHPDVEFKKWISDYATFEKGLS